MNKFKINTDFITLGQFLKATDHIGSGGEAKFFLFENVVLVNGEKRTERGKKLFHGDKVYVENTEYYIIYDSKTNT
ncbi:MAG: S4 domain-containing protein YaaA [Acholeplasmataceae bacterium]|nr:S4 domain-containing protein YaaA [Acholeplasmataceae bacterium]